MKPFELDSHMLTLRGVFYPTGHVLAMLPGRQQAEQAAALKAKQMKEQSKTKAKAN